MPAAVTIEAPRRSARGNGTRLAVCAALLGLKNAAVVRPAAPKKSQLFRRGGTDDRRIFQPEKCRANSEPRSISACRTPRSFDRNSCRHYVNADGGGCRLRSRKLQHIEVAAST